MVKPLFIPVLWLMLLPWYCSVLEKILGIYDVKQNEKHPFIQSRYIQPKLHAFKIFGVGISSRYRPQVNRDVVRISRNQGT